MCASDVATEQAENGIPILLKWLSEKRSAFGPAGFGFFSGSR